MKETYKLIIIDLSVLNCFPGRAVRQIHVHVHAVMHIGCSVYYINPGRVSASFVFQGTHWSKDKSLTNARLYQDTKSCSGSCYGSDKKDSI